MELHYGMSTIEALDRAMTLLEQLAENPKGLGLLKLAEYTKLAPSTAHRYLAALQKHNLVEQNEGKLYRLTSRLYLLGLGASEGFDLEAQAQSSLHKLAALTQETSCLMVPDGKHSVCISQVDSKHQLKIAARVGSRQDLRVGATSRTLLAYMDPKIQFEVLNQAPIEGYTDNTITDPVKIKATLDAIWQNGYYVSTGEVDDGVIAIAAPVRNRLGEVIAALAIAAPESRLQTHVTLQKIISLVSTTAGELSAKLGFLATSMPAERELV